MVTYFVVGESCRPSPHNLLGLEPCAHKMHAYFLLDHNTCDASTTNEWISHLNNAFGYLSLTQFLAADLLSRLADNPPGYYRISSELFTDVVFIFRGFQESW